LPTYPVLPEPEILILSFFSALTLVLPEPLMLIAQSWDLKSSANKLPEPKIFIDSFSVLP